MANINLGNLSVNLALESSQFIAGLKRSQAQTEATGAAISKTINQLKGLGSTLAALFAVDYIKGQVQSAFDFADAIQDLSDRTGASTKIIQEFRYAAQLSGSSVEGADAAVEKFSKNLGAAANGNQAMIKQFKDLGVTSTNVDTALKQAADGISKLPTKAQQAATAVSVFGKSAMDLAPLLSKGSQGFNELAHAADELGIVIDGDLISNAGQVNDKLDAMRMILTAQFASVIIQNADAISSLASSISGLVSSLVQFWGSNPQAAMALLGAGVGAMTGGRIAGIRGALVGAAVGGGAGFFAGQSVDTKNRAANPALYDARRNLAAEQNNLRATQEATRSGKVVGGPRGPNWLNDVGRMLGATDNLGDMFALRGRKATAADVARAQQRVAAAQAKVDQLGGGEGGGLDVVNPDAPKLPGLKPTPKASAAKPDQTEKATQRFQEDLERADLDLLSARRDAAVEVTDRTALDREIAAKRAAMEERQIDADTGTATEIADGKKRYTQAQADELKAKLRAVTFADYDAINARENADLSREELTTAKTKLDIATDALSGELELARGRTERIRLQKLILKNEAEAERLSLQAIVDSKAPLAERNDAQARLNALPAQTDRRMAAVDRSNRSPGGSFLDSIPQTADEMNDALESVATDGLGSLSDGLLNAVKGVGSLGDAFSSMANTVIDGLLKIALQQAIIKPLANMLFGGGDGGGLGGLFGGLFHGAAGGAAGGATGARANGGMTSPGSYLVGERGPELVNIGRNSTVVNTRQLGVANDNQGGGFHVSFGNITSNDPAAIRAVCIETMAQAAPVFRKQGVDATMAKLRRPIM